MEFSVWDFENNVIDTQRTLMFPEKTASNYMGSPYAVETEKGIFYQKPRSDGRYDLAHVTKDGEAIIVRNIAVIASNLKYTCIVVHFNETGEFVLIDTRGIFFILETAMEMMYPADYSMYFDRKTGFYSVGPNKEKVRWLIRAVSKKKQLITQLSCAAEAGVEINPAFKKMLKKPEKKYIYLTILNSKKGKLIDNLINRLLPYEQLPNLFIGDTTRNIRIPIDHETLSHKEMHFLIEKYRNTYAINGIPVEVFLGTLSIDYRYKNKPYIYCAKASQSQYPKVMSMIASLKNILEVETDLDIYKRVIKKIIELFPTPPELDYVNEFGKLYLEYPEGPEHCRKIIKENKQYIKNCLMPNINADNIDNMSDFAVSHMYRDIYDLSKEFYKNEMKKYEEYLLSLI